LKLPGETIENAVRHLERLRKAAPHKNAGSWYVFEKTNGEFHAYRHKSMIHKYIKANKVNSLNLVVVGEVSRLKENQHHE